MYLEPTTCLTLQASCMSSTYDPHMACEVGTIIGLISQMRKLRNRTFTHGPMVYKKLTINPGDTKPSKK